MEEYTHIDSDRLICMGISPLTEMRCWGCNSEILDLTGAGAVVPNLDWEIATIHPVHHPLVDGGQCLRRYARRLPPLMRRRDMLIPCERSLTLWEMMMENVYLAAMYPGHNLETTEKRYGHRTLQREIAQQMARVAAIYGANYELEARRLG
jgi:hypothetical protein